MQIYEKANSYAAERGIIIADTKFEFGLDESATPPAVVLIDEVLTPDSSRFWSAGTFELGRSQDSYDKQYLRGMFSLTGSLFSLILSIDWLVHNGLKGKEGVEMPPDVAANTMTRYREAYYTLTGKVFDPAA